MNRHVPVALAALFLAALLAGCSRPATDSVAPRTVRAYNVKVRQFPANIIAGLRGFQPNTAYFQAGPAAQEAPPVDFSSSR